MSYRYTIILEHQPDGGYHVSCPALPGCRTEGDSLDEALSNMKEAIELYIESLKAHGEDVPTEDLMFKPIEVAV